MYGLRVFHEDIVFILKSWNPILRMCSNFMERHCDCLQDIRILNLEAAQMDASVPFHSTQLDQVVLQLIPLFHKQLHLLSLLSSL